MITYFPCTRKIGKKNRKENKQKKIAKKNNKEK